MVKKPYNIANLSEFVSYPLSINVLVKTCKYLKCLLTTDSELLQCVLKKVLLVMSLASCVDFQLLKRLGISNKKAYHCFVLRVSIFSNTLYVLYTSVLPLKCDNYTEGL